MQGVMQERKNAILICSLVMEYKNSRCKQLEKSFIHNMNEGQINYVTSQLRKKCFSKSNVREVEKRKFGNKSGI